jgi:hypothetical protein
VATTGLWIGVYLLVLACIINAILQRSRKRKKGTKYPSEKGMEAPRGSAQHR